MVHGRRVPTLNNPVHVYGCMGEGYVSRVKEATGRLVDAVDRVVHGGDYLETAPVGERVSEEGVDFGLLHNAVKEYATRSDVMRYQQVVDRASEYVEEGRGGELSRDELTTLLEATIEVEMQAEVTARQYDNLGEVYSTRELVEKGLIDEEVMEGWRQLSDEEVEEREAGHLAVIATGERIRREEPRAAAWYETVQDLTGRVEAFVRHALGEEGYEQVREEALQRARASIDTSEEGWMETMLGPEEKNGEDGEEG